MSKLDTLERPLVHPAFENYSNIQNDQAFTSEIFDFKIESATKLSFDYRMPDDHVNGQVVVWEGLIINEGKTPIYRAPLNSNEGHYTINPGDINFLKGAYTIAITADGNLNTVAATQSTLSGQPVQQGMSSLTVIAKTLNSINTFFNRPANAIASQDITWLILREGDTLGQGSTLATQTTTPGSSSGLVPVTFPAGTLREGQMYNVILNPGYSTAPFTAGYVFQYIVQ